MKKIFLMLLVLSLTFTLLASCGGTPSGEEGAPTGGEGAGEGGTTDGGTANGGASGNGGEEPTPPAPIKEAELFYEPTADGTGYTVVHNNTSDAVVATVPATYEGKPVVAIGASAFEMCESLMTVTLPESITSIGESAFLGCTSLLSFALPDSVTSIGNFAFYGCYNLASFAVSENLTSVGMQAFEGTAYYNNAANWEAGVLYLGKYLVSVKTDVTACTVKEGTAFIAGSAFHSCKSLTTVSIPASVTHLGVGAFFSCTALAEIRYAGTSEAWENVTKEMYWDMDAGDYTVVFLGE